jgi:hypothetical protein
MTDCVVQPFEIGHGVRADALNSFPRFKYARLAAPAPLLLGEGAKQVRARLLGPVGARLGETTCGKQS